MSEYQTLRDWAAGLFTGQVVTLRPIEDTDIQTLAHWWNHPDIALFNNSHVVQRRADENAAMFHQWADNGSPSGFGYAAEANGQLVGQVSVHSIAAPAMIGTLGILVGPEHQERGYGQDILKLAMRLAFSEYACRKLELKVSGYSDRGIHTYRKVGFQIESQHRSRIMHNGKWYDEFSMGILAEEYFASQNKLI